MHEVQDIAQPAAAIKAGSVHLPMIGGREGQHSQ